MIKKSHFLNCNLVKQVHCTAWNNSLASISLGAISCIIKGFVSPPTAKSFSLLPQALGFSFNTPVPHQ